MENVRKFARAYEKFYSINCEEDLKHNKLSLNDYNALFDVLKELSDCKPRSVKCMLENVARWCERAGFVVVYPHGTEVNYTISIN